MHNRSRAIVTLVFIGLVCAPRPAHAQVFKIGSFTKPTTAAPVNQTFAHGLGVTPKAMIFWTVGNPTENIGTQSYWWGFGVTDGTTSRSTSASSQWNVNPSNASRRSASKALTIVQFSEALQAEADMQATPWDATNFFLTWSNNTNTAAMIIHFLAIGGTGVTAKVVDWPATASGSLTDQTVTVGWPPDLVIHFMDYDATGPGAAGTCAAGACLADASFMLGAMDVGGHQWATSFYAKDAVGTTSSARAQRTDAAIEETSAAGGETLRAHFVSMDDGLGTGFKVHFDVNLVGAHRIYSLALTGVNMGIGTFNRLGNAAPDNCTAPCSQTITGLGFQPAAVLFSSFMTTTQVNQAPTTHARFGLGGTDGSTTEGTTSLDDKNGIVMGGATRSAALATEFANAFNVSDNDTASLFARGDISPTNGSFNVDGFTIKWTTNLDNNKTEILYLALGPLAVTSVTLTSFTATRLPDGKTRLEWRTGYEVNNAGFRVYREQDGYRVRITSSLIPAAALMGVSGGASTGAHTYTSSDPGGPPDGGPVRYWLEDVDLKGKSTWHGPIVPAPAPPRVPR